MEICFEETDIAIFLSWLCLFIPGDKFRFAVSVYSVSTAVVVSQAGTTNFVVLQLHYSVNKQHVHTQLLNWFCIMIDKVKTFLPGITKTWKRVNNLSSHNNMELNNEKNRPWIKMLSITKMAFIYTIQFFMYKILFYIYLFTNIEVNYVW